MTEAPNYTFTCPNCAGSFSISLEKIPPVRARFRCPHCTQPMDFPSRDEARVYASLQTQPPAVPPAEASPAPMRERARSLRPATPTEEIAAESAISDSTRFRVEKSGFETDVYDRRAIRNLIRTGEVVEKDRVRVDNAEPVAASDLPYLRSLFGLRKMAKGQPPVGCRTHTDKVAFYRCRDTSRPLCEDCSLEKKFGGTTIRVCGHCGGPAEDLVPA